MTDAAASAEVPVHYVTTDDGLAIAYRSWGDDRPGRPVVLHHGFAADGLINWVWPGIVDGLLAAGHRVIAVDARGHGASDKPHDPARYGEARMAADVDRLLEHLGLEEISLVGYSMGAIVSLIVAATNPAVRRLVVGGIGAGVVELGGVDRRVIEPSALADALEADDPATIPSGEARNFRRFADSTGADRLALAAQARSVHRRAIATGDITAPTLVVAGADDPLAAHPERLAAAIPGARHVVIAGDHLGAVGPELLASIVSFLEES